MNNLSPTPKANFGMTLFYGETMGDLINTPQWNGNISGVKWATSTLAETFGYAYGYDGVNRLTSADFGRSTNWADSAYDEKAITYDPNGNIKTYKRYGSNGKIMDDLKYTYCNNGYSNKLLKIDDPYAGGFPVTTSIGGASYYTYDTNGSLTSDNTKSLNQIAYNYLNLPQNLYFNNNRHINFIYDAAGTKLYKQADSSANIKSKQYYAGNMIYDKDKKLAFIITDEGRAVKYGSSFTYEYNVKDHLGNVRMVLKDTLAAPLVTQENHYYPFGLKMAGLGSVDKTSPKNEYLYNGKEMQEDFGLNWEDYEHRFYDPLRPTFGTIDRFSEKFPWQSPYCYAGNNPIRNIDIGGDSIVYSQSLTQQQRSTMQNTFQSLCQSSASFAQLYTFLNNSAQNIAITIGATTNNVSGQFTPNNPAGGQGGTITFRNAASVNQISTTIEELFHAYQNDIKPSAYPSVSNSNIEFESKLFKPFVYDDLTTASGQFHKASNLINETGMMDVDNAIISANPALTDKNGNLNRSTQNMQSLQFSQFYQSNINSFVKTYKSIGCNAPTYTATPSVDLPKAIISIMKALNY